MKRWTAVACGCALVLLIAAACSSSGSKHLTSPTVVIGATATPEPSVTPRSPQVRTGIPEVDTFIDALQVEPPRARRQAIQALISYQPFDCLAVAQQGSGQPQCRVGEQQGQPVQAFPYNSCVPEARRPDEIDAVVIQLAGATLYGVYKAPANQPNADYVGIVYHMVSGKQEAVEVDLQGGHIVAYTFSCTTTPAEFVQSLGLGSPVYQAEPP